VPKDLAMAVAWFRRAAEQGERIAQYNLAVMLVKGEGIEADPEEALKWYLQAAQQGVPEAQIAVGDFYAGGRVVAVDHDEARRWFEKAASQSHDAAQPRLAALTQLQERQPAAEIKSPRAGTGA
jgi:TPR repeat protein